MKKQTLLLAVLLSHGVLAEEAVTPKVETKPMIKKSETSAPKKWQVGLNVSQLSDELSGSETINMTGLNVQGSRDFQISYSVFTKTTLGTHRFNGEDSFSDYDTKAEYGGLFISQNISYLISSFKYGLKPYLEYGVGFGAYRSTNTITDSEIRNIYGLNKVDSEADFTSNILTLGMELQLANGLTPYIAYSRTNTSFTNDTATVDTYKGDFDTVKVDADLESVVGEKLSLGLNYRF